ncbi:dolichol kinase [Halarchaeum grantii]|uniref:dolichol kinase n=1 Tax=Halarchaeum grantii TaxID=1193105 RepID=UPI001668DD88|nr:dolichol kinase [Halarchaeum grantii]
MAELRRRAVHVSGAVLPLAWLLGVVPWLWIEAVLAAGLVSASALEAGRLTGRVEWWVFDELTREYEQDNPAGYFLYALGFAATGLVFDPQVAAPAMLMLTFGDPFSGLLHSGGLSRKPVPVMAATFALCLVLAVTAGVPLLAAACGALGATLADGLKPVVAGYVVDDNLTMPTVAAAAMWVGIHLT